MKKPLAMIITGLLCVSMFSMFAPHAKAQETIIFQDDFESYPVGPIPSPPWVVVFGGGGGGITDTYYCSPTKSLLLIGSYGNSIVVRRDFTSSSRVIGFEGCLMVADYGHNPQSNTASISFFNQPIAPWGRYYADIGFLNGYIWAGISPTGWLHQLQPFTPMTWYKIRVIIDKASRVYNVWVDDVLVGLNLVELNDPNEILSLQIGEGWDNTNCYFDDIKAFEVVRVRAVVDVRPDKLNLKSRGRWITEYIELPQGYNVADINASSLLLNGTISAEPSPTYVGDYDSDAIPDLMVRFNRTNLVSYIVSQSLQFGNVTLTTTGQLYNGTEFEGNSTIKVSALIGDVNCDGKVDIGDIVLTSVSYAAIDEGPNWNANANFATSYEVIDILDLVTIAAHYGEKYP